MFWLYWLMVKVKGLVAVLCAVNLRAALPGLSAFAGEAGVVGVEASEDAYGTRPAHRPVPRPALHSCVPLTANPYAVASRLGRSRSASGGEGRRSVGSIRSQRYIHHISSGLFSGHVPARSLRAGMPSVRLGVAMWLSVGGVRVQATATA